MILFNQDLNEDDCEFNADEKTSSFLLSFFGFYKHDTYEFCLNEYLKEIGVEKVISDDKLIVEDEFKLNSNVALEAYNVCDRRTVDVALILPKVFNSKSEAIDWFYIKIKESEYIKKKEIDEVEVLDAEKFIKFLNKEVEYNKKVKKIDAEFDENINKLISKLCNEMISKNIEDPDFLKIIRRKFKNFNNKMIG